VYDTLDLFIDFDGATDTGSIPEVYGLSPKGLQTIPQTHPQCSNSSYY